VHWRDEQTLEVRYPPGTRVFHQVPLFGATQVLYLESVWPEAEQ